MCSLVGALLFEIKNEAELEIANRILSGIYSISHHRGRDGRGWVINTRGLAAPVEYKQATRNETGDDVLSPNIPAFSEVFSMIGNLRAEPTTEYVREKTKDDQQPYTLDEWSIVHNGTIANDQGLRTHRLHTTIDSASIVEQLATVGPDFEGFVSAVRKLRGSYAILAMEHSQPDKLYVAANYRPIWYIETPFGMFFASSRHFLPEMFPARMVEPYTACVFGIDGVELVESLYPEDVRIGERALVVCSGGLDSVVSAAIAQKKMGMDIELIHFLYGSRAEGPEVRAVEQVAEALDCKATFFPLPVYSKGDSPLLDPDSKVAGGEAGAEFAYEWVPARNLLLLSVATAYAEAHGFDTIVLGNNLEEAGAYPDNEPEFIDRFNDLLPFAVADGKRIRVIMPVGNLMKHEIVKIGQMVGAPLHLTWSCYRAGDKHCGTCGPCYMRRKAFEINGLDEVISYKDEE